MLKLSAVEFSYHRRRALVDVTATAQPGQFVGVVGRNGSGKSTLLRLIAGLVKPSLGCVEWMGRQPGRMHPTRKALHIAYVAQRPALAIELTVSEVVSLGLYAAGTPVEGQLQVNRAIDAMGLCAHRDRSFHQVSAGEQQRCVIARALAQHRPGGLLVLDEPFSNLDPGEAVRVAAHLRRLTNEGSLVVAAVHDLTLVDACTDCVWWLDQGRLLGVGRTGDVLDPSRLGEVFGCRFIRGEQGLTVDGTMMGAAR